MQKRTIIFIATAVIFSSAMLTGVAQASMRGGNRGRRGDFASSTFMHGQLFMKPTVMGTVSAINGTTLTVADRKNGMYTVDVTNAKITKGNAANPLTLTVADIAVGDTVVVSGTASGTAVTATSVFDKVGGKNKGTEDSEGTEVGKGGDGNENEGRGGMMATTTRGIFGKVTAVNGSVFTVASVGMRSHGWSGASSTTSTYTVAITSTTVFTKDRQPATLTDLTVGANVMIRGTIDTVVFTATATNVNIVTLMMKPLTTGWGTNSTTMMFKRGLGKGFGRGMHNRNK